MLRPWCRRCIVSDYAEVLVDNTLVVVVPEKRVEVAEVDELLGMLGSVWTPV